MFVTNKFMCMILFLGVIFLVLLFMYIDILTADLRSLQRGNYQSPRQQSRRHSPDYSSPRDDKIPPPPPQETAFGDATHARGGHGIFGQPKVYFSTNIL